MSTYTDKIVEVDLLLDAGQTVSETSVSNALFLTTTTAFTDDLYRMYTSTSAMLSDGFFSTDPAYIAASLAFQGTNKPDIFYVGRRPVTDYQLTVGTVTVGDVYSLTLKTGAIEQDFTYTAVLADTATTIASALVTAIGTTYSTKATISAAAGVITIVPTASIASGISVVAGDNVTITTTIPNGIVTDLNSIYQDGADFFWLMSDSHATSDILALAAWSTEYFKVYAWSTQDSGVLTGATTTALYQVYQNSYKSSWMVGYWSDADSTYPEAAGIGSFADVDPGSSTMHGRTMVGVSPVTLSTTQKSKITQYNGNYYVTEHGAKFYREGFMGAENFFVDQIHFAYWFKMRTETSLVSLLKRNADMNSKVTIDDEGKTKIQQALWNNPINPAIRYGAIFGNDNGIEIDEDSGLKHDYRPYIYIPSRASLTSAELTLRIWSGLKVTVYYRTPAHHLKITASITQ